LIDIALRVDDYRLAAVADQYEAWARQPR